MYNFVGTSFGEDAEMNICSENPKSARLFF